MGAEQKAGFGNLANPFWYFDFNFIIVDFRCDLILFFSRNYIFRHMLRLCSSNWDNQPQIFNPKNTQKAVYFDGCEYWYAGNKPIFKMFFIIIAYFLTAFAFA